MKKTFTLISSVLAVLIAVLVYFLFRQKQQMNEMVEQMEYEKEELEAEYEDLAIQFDGYQELNIHNDSLQDLLSKEQQRVQDLLEELRITKVTNARRIAELKKELATVRQVMVGYVHQIDSLNRTNSRLTEENRQIRLQNKAIQEQNTALANQNLQLTETVTRASMLEIHDLEVMMLNRHDRKTRIEAQARKLQFNFTIGRNITTEPGIKQIYLRLVNPQGLLMQKDSNNLFTFENSEIGYSIRQEIEYAGEELPVSMFWIINYDDPAETIQSGYYNADFFVDGLLIGSFPFKLTK